jgi:hypothetical protein
MAIGVLVTCGDDALNVTITAAATSPDRVQLAR